MDRNLQIALVSAALAILWGYGWKERLRPGDSQFPFDLIDRKNRPGLFWAFMILLGVLEAFFISMALMYFSAWLDRP